MFFKKIIQKLFTPVKKQPAQSSPSISKDQWASMLKKAHIEVKAENERISNAVSKYSEEQYFECIKTLSEDAFIVVVSNIRPTDRIDRERGRRSYIQASKREKLEAELQQLSQMGMLGWSKMQDGSGYVDFNFSLMNELSKNSEQIALLYSYADANNIRISKRYYSADQYSY